MLGGISVHIPVTCTYHGDSCVGACMDPIADWLTTQYGYVIEEATKTRGSIPMDKAVHIVIDDKLRRGILNQREADTLRDFYDEQ